MTELQQIEFDMLKVFIGICDSLNLKYYLVCGSCLGAVKYNGFIPWDDDVDVALPREDYNRFITKAPGMLPEGLFLQNHLTDANCCEVFSKLRNSNTTFIERGNESIDQNHGVFVDVFPLDGLPNEGREKHFKKLKFFDRRRIVKLDYKRFSKNNITSVRSNCIYILYKLFGYRKDTPKTLCELNDYLSQFPTQECDIWSNLHEEGCDVIHNNPREWYGDGVMKTFEGFEVRVPAEFDKYLTRRYGDWRADLSDDQKVGHHFTVVTDLEHPYTDYIEKLPNGRIRIKTQKEVATSSDKG